MEYPVMEPETYHDVKQLIQPRNPVNAALLSIFTPGMGQVYNGQLVKGLLILITWLLLILLFGLTRAVTLYSGMVALVLLNVGIIVTAVVDAVVNANRRQDYILKPYNNSSYYLLMIAGVLCAFGFFDHVSILGIKSYKIQTTANEPNLHVGDYVMADMQAYADEKPDYGHLVVFKNEKGHLLLYRVIGLPGDRVRMQHNYPIINGVPLNVRFYARYVSDHSLHKMGIIEQVFTEELPNEHKHLVLRRYKSTNPVANDSVAAKVPDGCYYLLGDNRDNAADSRFIGPVKKEDIKGRIVFAFWDRKNGLSNRNMSNK